MLSINIKAIAMNLNFELRLNYLNREFNRIFSTKRFAIIDKINHNESDANGN